jgi:deazaflavin-dependent oxidoreductase (nitroreductase family)
MKRDQQERPASLSGRFTLASSEFINKRGLYAGRRSTKIHVAGYRRSRGRIGGNLPGWPQVRIALLDHTGAKTQKKRTSPLMYHEYGDAIVVAGTMAGQPTHPAWFHNVMANPETTVQIGAEVREVRARLAAGDERDRLWKKMVAAFPGYEFYAHNAKGREIPVVILDPC